MDQIKDDNLNSEYIQSIIDKFDEEESIKKIEYMMDFGSVAVLVNISLN